MMQKCNFLKKRMKSKIYVGTVLLLLLAASPFAIAQVAQVEATSSPLTYAEPPDLTPNLAIPDFIGTVDVGINTVTGSISVDYSDPYPWPWPDEADSFEFTIPDGLVVSQVELIISNFQSSGYEIARVRTFSGGTETLFISGNVVFANLIPDGGLLGPGNHDLQIHGCGLFGEPTSVSLSYQFNIKAEIWDANTRVENLIETVETMNLHAGTENSLNSKLQNVEASIEAPNADLRNDAINKLEAFINFVEAQRDKKISNEQADYLVAEAQKIIEMIIG